MDKNIDLHIHRKLSLLAGVWYPKPENYEGRSKCFRFLWKFYLYVPYAVMFVELVSQVIQIILSINNFEALTTCILSTVYVTQFLLKIAVLNKYDATFQRLFNELSLVSADLMSNPLGDQNFIKFHNEYYSVVKNIGVYKGSFQLASNICLNILFCIFSWVGMKRKVTAAFSWTPYDSSKNPGYTFTCLYEMICYGSVTARSGVVDLLFWVMIIIPMVQLNYLKYLLEIILKEKNELENGGHDDDDDDDGDVESYSSSCDEILTSQLKWWIKQHQRILRNLLEFDGLASAFLGVNYLASLIDLFMSGYVAISSSNWDIFQRILINAIIITDAFQLYVISLAGDWLRETSEEVADLGMSSVLFKGKRWNRQNHLFTLTRAFKSVQFRFGGVNPLSSQTFSKLIQLTMTYFFTILQIRNSKSDRLDGGTFPFISNNPKNG